MVEREKVIAMFVETAHSTSDGLQINTLLQNSHLCGDTPV